EQKMVRFVRDLVAIPSESAEEGRVIERIRREMQKTRAFDHIWTDPMGNLLGCIGPMPGRGPRDRKRKLIAIDAHVDTVGIGDRSEWKHDPYQGKVERGRVWGRGAGDQEGAVPAMVYAAKILRELDVDTSEYTLLFTFTVMEEDCDGLCWQYIIGETGIRPDAVVVTDSTDCQILRGHRGRMEIGVTCTGRSCHGSMPEKGDNAVYKIASVVREIEKLNRRLKKDRFLGKGTITVSYVDCKTPSLCAVPGQAYIHLDRRLTQGESKTSAVREVRDAVRRTGVRAKVEVLRYARPSYTGLVYETQKYFPTWCAPEDALQVRAAIKAHRSVLGTAPTVHRWTFSTNAVAIAGMHGIPCVGFGPAPENVAHTVNDSVPIAHMVKCAAFYAGFGQAYCDLAARRANKTPMTFRTKKG
ncbi:MAG: YgeY family selenium metabolism-linked hydrolase, partial [bacterium]|nr:YgeY family selenium metabolism-linked hydrolase [bacterium]